MPQALRELLPGAQRLRGEDADTGEGPGKGKKKEEKGKPFIYVTAFDLWSSPACFFSNVY